MPRNLSCSTCGNRMWAGPGSLPQGVARCHSCRRADPDYRIKQKRARGIVERWICAQCGIQCSRPATKGQRPKLCTGCRSSDWITPTKRAAIYERDAWECWLCLGSVDKDLIGSRDPWRPSLDHAVPRSSGGSDDASNLRLAHFWCNAVRGDGHANKPEDFRVGA